MKSRNFENKPTEEVKDEPVIKEAEVIRPKKYIVTVTNLALRTAPNGEKLGIAPSGIVMISEVKDGFGKLADGTGWVSMKYVRKVD